MRNVEGTGRNKPRESKYGTWKQLYKGESGCKWPDKCCIEKCGENADGGGHVHVEGKSNNVYILPMCDRQHNNAHVKGLLPAKNGAIALCIRQEHSVAMPSDDEAGAPPSIWNLCVII